MSRRPRQARAKRERGETSTARIQAQSGSFAEYAEGPMLRLLRGAIALAIGLLLLTPLIISKSTVYPFVVGKALWARGLIEIAFALWVLLAIAGPAYRPPRSWLLLLLAVSLAVSLLSGVFGVSPEHSLWSAYERMLGVIDQAHWLALALVLASFLRTEQAWRSLFAANLAVGTFTAGVVFARALEVDIPFFGDMPERSASRHSGPLGNPIFLSVYMLANLVLAVGFAASSWAEATPRRRLRAFGWACLALPQLAGFILAGSVGGLAGLYAASLFAALAGVWLARGGVRLAAIILVILLVSVAVGASLRFFDASRTSIVTLDERQMQWTGGRALNYMSRVHLKRPSVQSRLAAWEAGWEGFKERPLLGWGPGNYATVFGLYGTGYAAASDPHDLAHGKLFELAATTGAAGLLAWCALWGLALLAYLGGARRGTGPPRPLILFAGAALAGHLVQLQFMFDTAVGLMLSTLLLAYAARLESDLLPARWQPRLPLALTAITSERPNLTRNARRSSRTLLALAAVALSLWGIVVNQRILNAADTHWIEPQSIASGRISQGIDMFPPLANQHRGQFISELTINWPGLRRQHPAHANRLLSLANREAAAATEREPWNWQMQHRIARFYAAVAETDSQYRETSRRHMARARELAPMRTVFPPDLTAPAGLVSTDLPGGQTRLEWQPVPHAGYHQVTRSGPDGVWSAIGFEYDASRNSLTTPACEVCRYRIRACRSWSKCSPWSHWP